MILNDAEALRLGTKTVSRVYRGTTQVWPWVYGPQERLLSEPAPSGFSTGEYTFGLQFTPNADGQITHIRAYSPSGTRIYTLWDTATQTRLFSTRVDHPGWGWYEVELPTPVAVVAGTSYTATSGATFPSQEFCYGAGFQSPPHLTSPVGLYGIGQDAYPTIVPGGASHYLVDVVYRTTKRFSGK